MCRPARKGLTVVDRRRRARPRARTHKPCFWDFPCGARGPIGRETAHFYRPRPPATAGPPCGAATKTLNNALLAACAQVGLRIRAPRGQLPPTTPLCRHKLLTRRIPRSYCHLSSYGRNVGEVKRSPVLRAAVEGGEGVSSRAHASPPFGAALAVLETQVEGKQRVFVVLIRALALGRPAGVRKKVVTGSFRHSLP